MIKIYQTRIEGGDEWGITEADTVKEAAETFAEDWYHSNLEYTPITVEVLKPNRQIEMYEITIESIPIFTAHKISLDE